MPATYTVKQVADILGYSTNSIYSFLKEKRIKSVRVGKGRFRIPQSELDRLLLVTKGKQDIQQSQSIISSPESITSVSPAVMHYEPTSDRMVPNSSIVGIFDWFIGIVSVIAGFSMILFLKDQEEFALVGQAAWIPAIRMTLIAGGFGLFIFAVMPKRSAQWQKIFLFLTACAYGFYAYILSTGSDWEGAAIYGSLAGAILFHFLGLTKLVASFCFFIGSLLLTLPIAVWYSGGIIHAGITQLFGVTAQVADVVFGAASLTVGLFYCTVVRRHGVLSNIVAVVFAVFLVFPAIICARDLYWARAFVLVITALLAVLVPVWDDFNFSRSKDRAFIAMLFSVILVFFLSAVAVIRGVQDAMIAQSTDELADKVTYAKVTLDSQLERAKDAIIDATDNPVLVAAIIKKKPDADAIQSVVRSLYQARGGFSRISVTDAQGTILAVYPLEGERAGSLAGDSRFVQAVSTGVMVSDESGSRNGIYELTVPIIHTSDTIIGVIRADVSLSVLTVRLSQLASARDGEYSAVIDAKGLYILHPESAMVGSSSPTSAGIRRGLSSMQGVLKEYEGGTRMITAYARVDSTGWVVGLYRPITSAIHKSHAAILSIFAILAICFVLGIAVLLSRRIHTSEDSP